MDDKIIVHPCVGSGRIVTRYDLSIQKGACEHCGQTVDLMEAIVSEAIPKQRAAYHEDPAGLIVNRSEALKKIIEGDPANFIKVAMPPEVKKAWAHAHELIDASKLPVPTSPEQLRFVRKISKMTETFIKKNTDYGSSVFEGLPELNLGAAQTAWVRAWDRIKRIRHLWRNEALVKDESMIDTLEDLAVDCIIIAIILEDEAKKDG